MRTLTLDALVLQTHNVGEADRFCILFTRESGKIAARARAVRKPGSRMGGTLLPLRRIKATLKETPSGYFVVDASLLSMPQTGDLQPFLRAQQGIEILLLSLQDEEPLPELFDATVRFLDRCGTEEEAVLPFTLRLLHVLGLLPETSGHHFAHCSPAQTAFATKSMEEAWDDLPALTKSEKAFFSGLCAELLSEAIARAPRAGVIAKAMS